MPGSETPELEVPVEGGEQPDPAASEKGNGKQQVDPAAAALEEVVAKAVDAALKNGELWGQPDDRVGESVQPLGSSKGAFVDPELLTKDIANGPQAHHENTGGKL